MLGKKLNAKAKAKKLLAVVLSALSVGSVGVYAEGGADSGEPRSDVAVNNANVVNPPCRLKLENWSKLKDRSELKNWSKLENWSKLKNWSELKDCHGDAFWNEDISEIVWRIYRRCEARDYSGCFRSLNDAFGGYLFIPESMFFEVGESIHTYLRISEDEENVDDEDEGYPYFKDMTRKKFLGIICCAFFGASPNETIFASLYDVFCPFPNLPRDLIPKLLIENDAKEITPRSFWVEGGNYVKTKACNILIFYMNFISCMREELFSEVREMTDMNVGYYLSTSYRTLFENWLNSDTTYNFVKSTNELLKSVRGELEKSRN